MELCIQISNDLRQSMFSVNEVLDGIFQKQCKGSGLLGICELLDIAEIHFCFSDGEAIFSMNFCFQAFRLAGAALAFVMIRWLSGIWNAGGSAAESGYSLQSLCVAAVMSTGR